MARTPKLTLRTIINDLVNRTNTDTRRLRVLEGMSNSVVSRINSAEQNILAQKKEFNSALSKIDSRISKLEESIMRIENVNKEMIKQMKKTVTTSKIKELENLIDIYNPIKSNFVTREELGDLLGDKAGKPARKAGSK